jgi:hypothetical protein
MVKIIKYDDISGVKGKIYAITPDISDFPKYEEIVPGETMFQNYINSSKDEEATKIFLSFYKAKIRAKFLSIKSFLQNNQQITLVGTELIVLETVTGLINQINPELLKEVKLPEPQEEIVEGFPLPVDKECMLYEQHAVVMTPAGERGRLTMCSRTEIGYVCFVRLEGINKATPFQAANLRVVEHDPSAIEKRLIHLKRYRPKYYR